MLLVETNLLRSVSSLNHGVLYISVLSKLRAKSLTNNEAKRQFML